MGATSRTKGKAGEPDPIEDAEPPFADRQARALQRQRERRARRSRIDYYPSADASKVIDSLRQRSVGGDASSIIDRALIEWGASRNYVSP